MTNTTNTTIYTVTYFAAGDLHTKVFLNLDASIEAAMNVCYDLLDDDEADAASETLSAGEVVHIDDVMIRWEEHTVEAE
jgi:hypothetical protein